MRSQKPSIPKIRIMSLNFSSFFLIITFLAVIQVSAQSREDSINYEKKELRNNTVFAFEAAFIQSIPVGNNYVGQGLTGKGGFGFRSQFYVYEGIYLGGGLSWSYLRVSDQEAVGAYRKAIKQDSYIYAGYDYRINPVLRATLDAGYGFVNNRNRSFTTGDIIGGVGSDEFFDTGNTLRFTGSIEYSLDGDNDSFSVFLSPAIEFANMRIDAPSDRSDYFTKARYLNLTLGLRWRSNKINRSITDNDLKFMQNLEGRDYVDLSIKEKRELYFLRKREKGSPTPAGTMNEDQDQKRLEYLLSQDNKDLTISERRELLRLKKKLKRENKRGN